MPCVELSIHNLNEHLSSCETIKLISLLHKVIPVSVRFYFVQNSQMP